MLSLLFVLGTALAAPAPDALQSALSSPAAFVKLYANYDAEFGKHYEGAEAKLRVNLFRANLRDVVKHNSEESTYSAGLNMFSDMTPEEKYSYTGANFSMAADDDAPMYAPPVDAPPAAGSKDWRGTAVTKIKNQGKCGSCWVFSATGAIEGQYKLQGSILKSFAEQEGLDCSMRNGCGGGWMQRVYDYSKKAGRYGPMSAIPYRGKEGSCRYSSKPDGLIAFKISGYQSVRGDSAHVRALDSTGPISVAYTVVDSFFKYDGGIYNERSCRNGGGHAVTSVGYAPSYFIMKNSWGNWGEKGYFRIGRGNVCGITDQGTIPYMKSTGKTDPGTDEGTDDGGDDGDCSDSHKNCAYWAGKGECEANPNWMLVNCRKSCNQCDDNGGDCQEGFKKCPDGRCVHEHWNC